MAVIALFVWEPHILQVDGCLDNGGRWDYEINECEEASGYPMIPYDCILEKGDWIQGEGCRVPDDWVNSKLKSEIVDE